MKLIQLTICMLTLSISCLSAQESTNTLIIRDPFNDKLNVSCDEISTQLIKQLAIFDFKGVLQSNTTDYQKIWLTNKNSWLIVSADSIPALLLPWQIISISARQVIWQTNLPDYCDRQLSFMMSFKD